MLFVAMQHEGACVLVKGTALTKLTDLALGIIIPFHSHVAMNSVISDYVPKLVSPGALGALNHQRLATVCCDSKLALANLFVQTANLCSYRSCSAGAVGGPRFDWGRIPWSRKAEHHGTRLDVDRQVAMEETGGSLGQVAAFGASR
jgi:CybS, succinate dehydrogenase cytochrome B small subunit